MYVCMYVWNTQGNLYVSGRLAANENHTLWFLRLLKLPVVGMFMLLTSQYVGKSLKF